MKNKSTIDLTKTYFNKKAFTLIELLAVIIILGILLIIAVPSVTKYINETRKSSYISSAKEIISGTRALANSDMLDMNKQDVTYYIPAKYIKTESNNRSPYGEFTEAYVGVILNDKGYRYYWISNDTSGQGIKTVTNDNILNDDLVEGNLKDPDIRSTVETTGIEDREKILILNMDGTWQEERTAQSNINENGEIEPVDTLRAIFAPGVDFNIAVKRLAGNSNADYSTVDNNVLYIKRSKEEPVDSNKQEQNIVSSADSEVPIYAWFDNGTIYWWSEDIKPNLNPDAGFMFAFFEGAKDIDLKYIKTNLTTVMRGLFAFCIKLENLDFSKFDTSNVTNMAWFFYGDEKIKKIDLSSFDTSKVTNMMGMFSDTRSLKRLDLRNFNTQNVTTMQGMFQNTEILEYLNISSFNTSKVTDMSFMFGCGGLDSSCRLKTITGFNKLDTSKVTTMRYMFVNQGLESLDFSNFNTSNVTTMEGMFFRAKSLKSLDLRSFNTSKVVDMQKIFAYCESLESLNISSFNTSKVTNMYAMFDACASLTTIDVSNLDTSKATNMAYMFSCDTIGPCHLTNIIGLTNFNTSNVIYMYYMFLHQTALRTVDISSFNTPKVTHSYGMFAATNLETIYASPSFTTAAMTNHSDMFNKSAKGWSGSNSYVLKGGAGTAYTTAHKDKEYARIDDPNNGMPGYFTLKTN